MGRPRLLDLYCRAGGGALGYSRAGYDVLGVDVVPQPRYPFRFVQADAMSILRWLREVGQSFDLIHASPPCQLFTRAKHLRVAQGKKTTAIDLIGPTRAVLTMLGTPYVIENVPGAPLQSPVTICGQSKEIALGVRRHRQFESNVPLVGTTCDHRAFPRPIGVYGSMRDDIPHGGKTAGSLDEASVAMGIDWMRWDELKEAIPPSYAEFIGRQTLAAQAVAA